MKKFRKAFRIIISLVMLVILCAAGYNIAMKYMYPMEYVDIVEKYSAEYHVDKALVMAIIKCESGFDPNAESEVGAAGLMQLIKETFNDMNDKVGSNSQITFETHAKDIDTNIRYGTRYLKYLNENFNGDKIAVIASYNAGLNNATKWLGADGKLQLDEIDFPETKAYVEKVIRAEKHYSKLLPNT